MYGHFGSKENLLVALVDEYLATQIAEQIALIDRAERGWERPIPGQRPCGSRSCARIPTRSGCSSSCGCTPSATSGCASASPTGLDALRAMFVGFATDSAVDAGLPITPGTIEGCANVSLGLSLGLAMLTLADPEAVAPPLLGTALSIFIQALESSDEARARLASANAGRVPLAAQHAQQLLVGADEEGGVAGREPRVAPRRILEARQRRRGRCRRRGCGRRARAWPGRPGRRRG